MSLASPAAWVTSSTRLSAIVLIWKEVAGRKEVANWVLKTEFLGIDLNMLKLLVFVKKEDRGLLEDEVLIRCSYV